MPSPLGSLFSTIDSAKRKVMDALMNPQATLENLVAEKNADAGAHLDDLRHMPMPGQLPQPGGNAAKERVLTALAEGYNPGGIFVGARAKGIDNIALAYAMKDARKGANPEEIWRSRGWAKGPDGNWRTEIDDSAIEPILRNYQIDRNYWGPKPEGVNVPNARPLQHGNLMGYGGAFDPLSMSVSHPDLFRAYPSLNEMKSEGIKMLPGTESTGYFARAAQGNMDGISASGPTVDKLRSALVHELQHAVQKREGWGGGGNPVAFLPSDFKSKSPEAQQFFYSQAFDRYQKIFGEAEARMAQHRLEWDKISREDAFPYNPAYFRAATGVPLKEVTTPNGQLFSQP